MNPTLAGRSHGPLLLKYLVAPLELYLGANVLV